MSGRVLVTDPLAADGLAILKEGKLEVDVRTGLKIKVHAVERGLQTFRGS